MLFSFSCISQDLLCVLIFILIQRIFHGMLRKMHIFIVLGRRFWRCLLGPFGLTPLFLSLSLVWMTCVGESGLLKSPALLELICVSSSMSFIMLGTLECGI